MKKQTNSKEMNSTSKKKSPRVSASDEMHIAAKKMAIAIGIWSNFMLIWLVFGELAATIIRIFYDYSFL